MASRLGDTAAARDLKRQIVRFNQANPSIPITAQSMRASLRTSRAENGIVINKRLEQRAREAGRFGE